MSSERRVRVRAGIVEMCAAVGLANACAAALRCAALSDGRTTLGSAAASTNDSPAADAVEAVSPPRECSEYPVPVITQEYPSASTQEYPSVYSRVPNGEYLEYPKLQTATGPHGPCRTVQPAAATRGAQWTDDTWRPVDRRHVAPSGPTTCGETATGGGPKPDVGPGVGRAGRDKARSRCRCGGDGPRPGADVAEESPVPAPT